MDALERLVPVDLPGRELQAISRLAIAMLDRERSAAQGYRVAAPGRRLARRPHTAGAPGSCRADGARSRLSLTLLAGDRIAARGTDPSLRRRRLDEPGPCARSDPLTVNQTFTDFNDSFGGSMRPWESVSPMGRRQQDAHTAGADPSGNPRAGGLDARQVVGRVPTLGSLAVVLGLDPGPRALGARITSEHDNRERGGTIR
jgi:hypothetical protein